MIDTEVSGVDIPPTIASIFGLESPEGWHGQSLMQLNQYRPKGTFGEAIGKLQHKVKETDCPVYFYQEGMMRISYRVENDYWELFDLSNDPREQNNIIETSSAAVEMKENLYKHIALSQQ